MGSTLKGKNLLQQEQILSVKSCPYEKKETKMKMAVLFPLTMSPFILICEQAIMKINWMIQKDDMGLWIVRTDAHD